MINVTKQNQEILLKDEEIAEAPIEPTLTYKGHKSIDFNDNNLKIKTVPATADDIRHDS